MCNCFFLSSFDWDSNDSKCNRVYHIHFGTNWSATSDISSAIFSNTKKKLDKNDLSHFFCLFSLFMLFSLFCSFIRYFSFLFAIFLFHLHFYYFPLFFLCFFSFFSLFSHFSSFLFMLPSFSLPHISLALSFLLPSSTFLLHFNFLSVYFSLCHCVTLW